MSVTDSLFMVASWLTGIKPMAVVARVFSTDHSIVNSMTPYLYHI